MAIPRTMPEPPLQGQDLASEASKSVTAPGPQTAVTDPDANVSHLADSSPTIDLTSHAVYPLGLSRQDLQRIVGLLLVGAAAGYFLWSVRDILPPFLIAFFLAALIDPALRAEERRGRSRLLSIVGLYLVTLLVLVVLAIVVLPVAFKQLQEFMANFDVYYDGVQRTAGSILHHNTHWLGRFGITQDQISEIISQRSGPLKGAILALLGGVTNFVADLATKLIWLVIIPIAGFFFLKDFGVLRARTIAMFPDSYHKRIDTVSREVVEVFSAYLRGLAKICSLYGFSMFVIFTILGLQYSLFLGLMAGLLYAVPYVGQAVTATVAGAVAYAMAEHSAALVFHLGPNSVGYTVGVVLTVCFMNNLFDQLVYPRIVAGSVGLHPVASIFALTAGATLFGLWGMMLAVPVAASIQIILLYMFPKLRQPAPAHLLDRPPSEANR